MYTLRTIILWIWAGLLCPLPALSEHHLTERVDRFRDELRILVDQADSTNTRPDRDRIEGLYQKYFPNPRLIKTSTKHTLAELAALHAGIEDAFSYTLSPLMLGRLGQLVGQITEQLRQDVQRGPDAALRYLTRFHADLLRARRFTQARDLVERYELNAPHWNLIDESPAGAGPAVLDIAADRPPVTLTRRWVDLGPDPMLVAVVHPHCGPSRRAMMHIENHPDLAALFANRTVWLADARQVNLEPLTDWNAQARETKISISYDNYAWPEAIGFMRTPVFYFLRDAVVRDVVIGWPGVEQVERLHAGFDAIGVDSGISPIAR